MIYAKVQICCYAMMPYMDAIVTLIYLAFFTRAMPHTLYIHGIYMLRYILDIQERIHIHTL